MRNGLMLVVTNLFFEQQKSSHTRPKKVAIRGQKSYPYEASRDSDGNFLKVKR